MNREDRVHGALLILNELVRISSMEGEVRAPADVLQREDSTPTCSLRTHKTMTDES